MEEGTEVETREPCKECGLQRAVVRAGYLYCLECGGRTGDSQPVLDFTYKFTDTGAAKQTKLTKKKKRKIKDDLSNMWSTWHAHNMILFGLVEEVSQCGATGERLSGVVLRLWSKWLRYNKVAFFSRQHNRVPELTMGFKPRDLKLLYGVNKRKKQTVITTDDPFVQKRRKALKSLNEYVKKEHENILNTQDSTFAFASQKLEDITFTATKIELKDVKFNPQTTKTLKAKLTRGKFGLHKQGYCSSYCKCLKCKRSLFKHRHTRTSLFNLYVLLYLGLRMNDDDVQLGDILRWCREGHLTFGDYRHFFPDDMKIKPTDRLTFTLSITLMTHKNILSTASRFARIFNLRGIKSPDIMKLVKRYIEELELPDEMYGIVIKMLACITKPPDFYLDTDKSLPNYEAMALSYIIICLKMLFGLDGISEREISTTARTCNEILNLEKHSKLDIKTNDHEDPKSELRRLFVFDDWMKYIEYRKVCISQCHYPTKLRYNPDNTDDPDLFLYHKTKMRKSQPEKVIKSNCMSIIKSLLQRVEDNYQHEVEKQFPVFCCSFTPMASSAVDLLNWQYLNTEYSSVEVDSDLLGENFSLYSLTFLINPKPLKDALRKKGYLLYAHTYCANTDIVVDKSVKKCVHSTASMKLFDTITVHQCDQNCWEGALLAETLLEAQNSETILNDTNISVKPVGNQKGPYQIKSQVTLKPIDLFICFENYWTRHYSDIARLTLKSFDTNLEQNFPRSFSWLMKECANVAEITTQTLYQELSKIEKFIIETVNAKK